MQMKTSKTESVPVVKTKSLSGNEKKTKSLSGNEKKKKSLSGNEKKTKSLSGNEKKKKRKVAASECSTKETPKKKIPKLEQETVDNTEHSGKHSKSKKLKKILGDMHQNLSPAGENDVHISLKVEIANDKEVSEVASRKAKLGLQKKRKKLEKNRADAKKEKLKSFLQEQKQDNTDVKETEGDIVEEMETSEHEQTNSDKKPIKKMKKRKAKQQKDEETEADASKPSAKDLSLSYLDLWKDDRKNWSFRKARQIWLIKNMYNEELVDKKYFDCLLNYLEESKGGVRARLIEAAQSIYESSSTNEDEKPSEDPVKVERARMVIQMLSE